MSRLEALAVLALMILAGLFLFDHDAWTPDEPRVVALGQSVARGSWVVPRLNGEPFLEQPPFHAWCVALGYQALGERVVVARAVSVVCSLLTLLLTFLLGERLADRRVGVLAALLLGTSWQFFYAEHRVTSDPPLALFVLGSTFASYVGLSSEKKHERFLGLFLAYALASLAYLSKGVVGVGLSGFGMLAYVLSARDPKLLLRAKLWLAPLVFLLVTGPYHYRLHEELGTEGLLTVALYNTVERAGTDSQHAHNVLYYLWQFPLVFLPTTLFFLGGVRAYFKERDKRYELPLFWFALGFFGLSLAHSKREVYLLPILPGAALVSALFLERFLSLRSLAVGVVSLVALVTSADLTLVPYFEREKALGPTLKEAVSLVPKDRAVYVLYPDETSLGAVPFYTGRDVAPIPTALGTKDPLVEAPRLLAEHLHGERDLWALAIEKREGDIYYRSVASLRPEVAYAVSGSRSVRLLHFHSGPISSPREAGGGREGGR